ncbi:hypothetical protein DFH27DRAFT_656515 [Peziza echinospora]|nr:hypothetical protein DFH27DRAFT_656515 [Peziza echinospora]
MSDIDWAGGVCGHDGAGIVAYQNKLYINGGAMTQRFPAKYNITGTVSLADSFLHVLDFSQTITLPTNTALRTPFHSLSPLDSQVPLTTLPYMFPSPSLGVFRFFGGKPEFFPSLTPSGQPNPNGRDTLANKLSTYDMKSQKWSTNQSVASIGSRPSIRGVTAYDPTRELAYLFGGKYERSGYTISAPDIKGQGEYVSQANPAISEFLEEYKQLDVKSGEFTNFAPPPKFTSADFAFMKAVVLPGVGQKGIVVMFGGMPENELAFREARVFDPEKGKWYTQSITAQDNNYPSTPRTDFCVVTASAEDNSSHMVYLYGGYKDSWGGSPLSDIYVLTLPAFHWILVPARTVKGTGGMACEKVQEKYMVAYRGNIWEPGCMDETGGVQVFDMVNLQWTRTVEAGKKFEVPGKVVDVIGGGPKGGATYLAPKGGWANTDLKGIFESTYRSGGNGDNESGGNTTTPNPTSTPPAGSSPTGTNLPAKKDSPPLAPILGGVFAGLVVIIGLLLLLLCVLKKRRQRNGQNQYPKHEPQEVEGNNHSAQSFAPQYNNPPYYSAELYANPPEMAGHFVQIKGDYEMEAREPVAVEIMSAQAGLSKPQNIYKSS